MAHPFAAYVQRMSSSPESPRRVPQQARGHERAQRILDGCARLIVAKGMAGVTMNAIAKESSTAIGSLYHFFPNKEAVVNALGQRHIHALNELMKQIRRISAQEWIEMATPEVVLRLAMPLVEYLAANPDCLIATDSEPKDMVGSSELVEDIVRTYDFAFRARMPQYDEHQRKRQVMATLALPIGILQMRKEDSILRAEILEHELPCILLRYISGLELSELG